MAQPLALLQGCLLLLLLALQHLAWAAGGSQRRSRSCAAPRCGRRTPGAQRVRVPLDQRPRPWRAAPAASSSCMAMPHGARCREQHPLHRHCELPPSRIWHCRDSKARSRETLGPTLLHPVHTQSSKFGLSLGKESAPAAAPSAPWITTNAPRATRAALQGASAVLVPRRTI